MDYSKNDVVQQQTAFSHLFGCSKEVCNSKAIKDWIENTPSRLVEFDYSLQGESNEGKDKRMEMFQVYDGNFKELVDYLRELYPDKRTFSKWELMFDVLNGIMPVKKDLDAAINRQLVKSFADTQQVKGDLPLNENEEKVVDGNKSADNGETKSEFSETTSTGNGLHSSELTDVHRDTNNNNIEEEKFSMAKNNKDNKGTSDTINLDALAGMAGESQSLGNGNTDAPKPVVEDKTIQATINAVTNTIELRTQWTKDNQVEKIIAATEPTSLRFKSDATGVIASAEGVTRANAVNKAYKNFCAATGYDEMDIVEDATLREKFPKVKDIDEARKAEAVLELIQKLKNDNNLELPIYISDKAAWSVKGVIIGGTSYCNSEFRDLLIAKSAGAAYAVGSLDATGKPVKDATTFVLSVASKKKAVKQSTDGQSPTTQAATNSVTIMDGVVRIKNKAVFLDKGGSVTVVYPTLQNPTPEQMKYVSAKPVITVAGKQTVASFRYEAEEKTTDAAGNDIEAKMKTFSLTVRALAALTSAEPAAQFGSAEEAAKFGKAVGLGNTVKEQIDYTSTEVVSKALLGTTDKNGKTTQNAMVKLMAAMAMGRTETNASLGEAERVINSIKASASDAETAENEAAANEMDDELM